MKKINKENVLKEMKGMKRFWRLSLKINSINQYKITNFGVKKIMYYRKTKYKKQNILFIWSIKLIV